MGALTKTLHVLLLFFIVVVAKTPWVIDPKLTKVWGPGLEPHKLVMPARYFFIQAVDKDNNNVVPDIPEPFTVVIDGTTPSKKPCRIWTNILNKKDGLFIVRYKLYEQCSYLKINVIYQSIPVAKSPYIINQNIYSDDCICPENSLKDIINKWQCGEVPKQILKDFKEFPKVDWNVTRESLIKEFHKPHQVAMCHYIIKNNQIHRKCYGEHVGFNMFSDKSLLSITRKVKLPNLEFFMNLGDWPLAAKHLPVKYPMLSWCSSNERYDIVLPTYELMEATLENMGSVMLDMLSVQGNTKTTWDKRESKLFWRGRDSNQYRLKLIKMAKENPELFNVSLTNFFFYRDQQEEYGPKSPHVSFYEFFDYKYQLAIDGTVAPYRMPFLLGGGSTVFKTESKYYEHFYGELTANKHYVPVKTDLSDLLEKLEWAENHQNKAKVIAYNGQKFANDHLLPKNIFCYYFHVLNELSKKIVSQVEILEGMEEVKQKLDSKCVCKEANVKYEL